MYICQVSKVRLCDIAKKNVRAAQLQQTLKIECLRLAENAPAVASFNTNKSYGSKMTLYRILQINYAFDSCSTDLTNLVERTDNDHTAGKGQQGEEELKRCHE